MPVIELKEITELKAGVKYKCVDVDGFLASSEGNDMRLLRYFPDGYVTFDSVSFYGDGLIDDEVMVDLNEYKYFREVVEVPPKNDIDKILAHPQVDRENIKHINLMRLVDGDLSHIGKAIEDYNSEVLVGGSDCDGLIKFKGKAGIYSIKPKTKELNGYEYPAPETEAPEIGTKYFIPSSTNSALYVQYCWQETAKGSLGFDALMHGEVHLTKENAIAHATARILAQGGEV